MHTDPKIETRAAVPYFGIRLRAPVSEFSTVIPQTHDEVFDWLAQNGIEPAGAPFIRYHVIDMGDQMDIEMGVPAESTSAGDGRVTAGVLPAGRYATLIYTDIDNGIPANTVLVEWAKAQGLVWDRWNDPNGDAFASRFESFLTEPDDEPDMAKWETEVAIKLAD
jgi:effector-binding domain-containing protein